MIVVWSDKKVGGVEDLLLVFELQASAWEN